MSIQLFTKIKNNSDYRRLFENFISLAVLQGLNYILPLITFPYQVRVLGVEKFGLLAFVTATVAYLQIFTDYGFNLSATREVAIHRDNKEKLEEIFSSVMIIKIGLFVISFLLLTVLVFSFKKFRHDWFIYYLAFGTVLGQVLFPVWFFQGMERMRYITFLNILAKSFFTIAIFVFIKEQEDYWMIPLLNSIGFLVAGGASLLLIKKQFNVSLRCVKAKSIQCQLQEGWHVFVSSVAISLYTISTTFILGLFTNNTIVGYYSAADKIIQAVKGLYTPFSQGLFPFISKKTSESKEMGLSFIQKITKYTFAVTSVISLFVFLFSKSIIAILLGKNYQNSIIVLKIFSIHPLLIGLSNVFGIQTMLVFNRKKAFQNILILASIINICLSLILIPFYNHIGSAISVTVVEFYVTIAMFIYLQKTGIKIMEFSHV
ncbi:MAG: flippase [Treponemataceae bacterium]|nr:flippase [Treponemataceae bacterium]